MKVKLIWRIIYIVYPPFLRVLEKVKIHEGRQNFLLGYLNKKYNLFDLRDFLFANGYEDAILAWKDTGEILNMRLIDKEIYQYHLRVFENGEIRGHYEYSPESHPLKHVSAIFFENRNEYFEQLFGDFLLKTL